MASRDSLFSSEDTDGYVFCQLIAIVEDYDQVDVELYLKFVMDVSWARVYIWEQHVEWYLDVWHHVAICDLYVLDLSSVSFVFEGLNANKLDLDWFD